MSGEWKPAPGDVADVRNEYGVWNRAICTVGSAGFTWRFGVALTEQPVAGSEAHPLVVVDPEDREQVERLLRPEAAEYEVRLTAIQPEEVAAMQAALRRFAAPKPDEPQNRYAVVLDADDVEWLRSRDGLWAHCRNEGMSTRWETRSWSAIAAVRVISEGVPT